MTAVAEKLHAALRVLVADRAERLTALGRDHEWPGMTVLMTFEGGTAAAIGRLGPFYGSRWVIAGIVPAGTTRLEAWPHAKSKAGEWPTLRVGNPKRPAPRLLCADVLAATDAELAQALGRAVPIVTLDLRSAI